MVGEAIASRLVELGHHVLMGSRTANNDKGVAWAKRAGKNARAATFAEAADESELVFNCTHGASSLEALQMAGAERLAGKVLVDVANILGPGASSGGESLGERIQRAFPKTRVVKTLNTINCDLMVNAGKLTGPHTLFISGDDGSAKQIVRSILEQLGWRDVIDLGDITTARATEAYVTLWLALYRKLGSAHFNIQVVR
jgi:predicted dinucleotide-binding enzyme